jgi:hypothetical protein
MAGMPQAMSSPCISAMSHQIKKNISEPEQNSIAKVNLSTVLVVFCVRDRETQ